MRVFVQWASATPADWKPIDIRNTKAVRNLPKRAAPIATDAVDNLPGWICAINCQGITFSGYDHTAIEVVGDSLKITGWNDDTEDFGDTRWATQWLLSPPAPDPLFGGQINTVQQRTIWATPDAADWFGGTATLPWEQFVKPPANMTLHGIWLPDSLWRDHVTARTTHGWREWAQ